MMNEDILIRYFMNEVSINEKESIKFWLNEDPKNIESYFRVIEKYEKKFTSIKVNVDVALNIFASRISDSNDKL